MAAHTAVSCNQLEIVKILIKHGANLNFQAQNWGVVPMTLQESPLHLATYFGYNEIAQLLLENGAYRDVTVEGVKPLHFAVSNSDSETINVLLKKSSNGWDFTGDLMTNVDPKDQNGFTPLHRAIQSNRKEIVELLIAKGANIEMSTLSGTRVVIKNR